MSVFDQVLEFHQKMGNAIDAPEVEWAGLARMYWTNLREEVEELHQAYRVGSALLVADALADIIYFAVGLGVAMGIPVEEVFNEVHKSNMTKDPNPDGGKALKGAEYVPPNIRKVFDGRSER